MRWIGAATMGWLFPLWLIACGCASKPPGHERPVDVVPRPEGEPAPLVRSVRAPPEVDEPFPAERLAGVDPGFLDELGIEPRPPAGWTPTVLESTGPNRHVVWRSPSGANAYGVIRFQLPIPVPPAIAVWGYMQTMRRNEGHARLVEQGPDRQTGGVIFAAEGGRFFVRNRLFVRNTQGWAVYAGARRDMTGDLPELEQALQARDDTIEAVVRRQAR